jgi:RHS repeat-associated protein
MTGKCNIINFVYISFAFVALFGVAHAEVRYVHSDHLGSLAVGTNSAGVVEQSEYYTPFGEILCHNPPSPPFNKGGNGGIYLFTGQELDRATELYYYGARYYDSVLARFTSVDSIEHHYPYAYVHHNPLSFVDPDGLAPADPRVELFFSNVQLDQLLQGIGRARGRLEKLAEDVLRYREDLARTDRRIGRIDRMLERLAARRDLLAVERSRSLVEQRSRLTGHRSSTLADLGGLKDKIRISLKEEGGMLEALRESEVEYAKFGPLHTGLKIGIGLGITLFLPMALSELAEASEIPELEVAALFANPQQFIERGREASEVVVRAIEGDEGAYSQVMSFIEGVRSRFPSTQPTDSDEMGFWDREVKLPKDPEDPCFWGCE